MKTSRIDQSVPSNLLAFLIGVIGLLMLSSFITVAAQSAVSGLRIGIGPRALAMGGAYVAVADNYSAPFWNPAGIGKIDKLEAGGGNMDRFGLRLNYTHFGGGATIPLQVPLIEVISGAGGLLRYTIEVRATDSEGNPLGKVTITEDKYLGTLGLKLSDFGYIGGNIKGYHFLHPKMGVDQQDAKASGLGYDVGFLAGPFKGLWFGGSGFDLTGTDIKWENPPTEPTDTAPPRYSLGTAWISDKYNFILSGQYDFGEASQNSMKAGGEYRFSLVKNIAISIRGGLVVPKDSEAYFSAGGGMILFESLKADFAWVQNKALEAKNTSDTLVFGAGFEF